MSNTYKVIYSTLAVVMVVNSFVFALPIVGQAQSIEKQAIAQAELTATQKAELEKAQKEARLAMYKELKLSTAEKRFVEKYTDKLESFNQVIDKYVNYNKTNGNATVDVTAIYKNMKAIRTVTGLTQNEVLTVKDIALKLVKNYNMVTNSVKVGVIKVNVDTLNKSENGSENYEMKVAKVINERGYTISAEPLKVEKLTASSVKLFSSPTCKPRYWSANGWFYYKVYTDNCAVTHYLSSFSNFQLALSGIGFVAGSFKIWQVSVAAGGLGYYYQQWKWTIEQANYKCGQTGILLEGNIWSAWYPIPKAKC